ncbi:RNase RNM [Thalassotalea marina]|uniref:Phosphatase n=1 Tax=Thalassotalea marina TaxID=1673741 RepID=A0A919ENY8_9GAMM|nr:PHP domain-containing protein [Thalassotalea marina]GHG06528.1 phosphatase [Thalassotalea marina]
MPLKSTDNFTEMFNGRVDLHSHTNCSDGGLTPQELIERAVNFQIDVLAITDHDTTAGLDIAESYIKDKNYPITLVDGIEISTRWHNFEIHIVGLNINKDSDELKRLVASQQASREQRAIDIGNKLTKCGFDWAYEKAKGLAGEGSITRAHFAKALYQHGVVNNLQAAFDKYIGKGKRAYVKPNWCDIQTAIAVIHQSGGTAVMAHPIRYDMTTKWLRKLVIEFKQAGGDGLEIVLPQMNNQQRDLMLSFCLEYELHASLGSDFHYPSKWSDLGRNLVLPEKSTPIWTLWQ